MPTANLIGGPANGALIVVPYVENTPIWDEIVFVTEVVDEERDCVTKIRRQTYTLRRWRMDGTDATYEYEGEQDVDYTDPNRVGRD